MEELSAVLAAEIEMAMKAEDQAALESVSYETPEVDSVAVVEEAVEVEETGVAKSFLMTGEEWEKEKQRRMEEVKAELGEDREGEFSDWFVFMYRQKKKECAACESCGGVPCKKTVNVGFKFRPIVDAGTWTIANCRCPYITAENRKKKIAEQFKRAKIPAKYLGKTLADYKIDEFNKNAVAWYKSLLEKPQSLYLYGVPGVGKTFLMSILAQEYLKRGRSVIFADVPNLLAELRTSFGKDVDKKLEEMQESLMECDVLFLDDLGAEMATQWSVEQLYLIINARYAAGTQIIVTSNHNLDELAGKLNNPKGADKDCKTGSRISSRLSEHCKLCRMQGNDRRIRARAV